jgi:hypothetical protein
MKPYKYVAYHISKFDSAFVYATSNVLDGYYHGSRWLNDAYLFDFKEVKDFLNSIYLISILNILTL